MALKKHESKRQERRRRNAKRRQQETKQKDSTAKHDGPVQKAQQEPEAEDEAPDDKRQQGEAPHEQPQKPVQESRTRGRQAISEEDKVRMAEILERSKAECTGFLDVFDPQHLWEGEDRYDCPAEWKYMLVGLTSTQLLSLESGAVAAFHLIRPKYRQQMLHKGWLALQKSQARTPPAIALEKK